MREFLPFIRSLYPVYLFKYIIILDFSFDRLAWISEDRTWLPNKKWVAWVSDAGKLPTQGVQNKGARKDRKQGTTNCPQ